MWVFGQVIEVVHILLKTDKEQSIGRKTASNMIILYGTYRELLILTAGVHPIVVR